MIKIIVGANIKYENVNVRLVGLDIKENVQVPVCLGSYPSDGVHETEKDRSTGSCKLNGGLQTRSREHSTSETGIGRGERKREELWVRAPTT